MRTAADPLAPFEPTAADPFDLAKAGHLARRVAFGVALRERERLARLGPERALQRLLDRRDGEHVGGAFPDALALASSDKLRAYRVWRLLRGRDRLAERMSYFWHGHFATSDAKVASPRLMAQQLAVFDRLGLGCFDQLVLAVSRDPAMLRFLDNDTNVRGHANENYARELFELFTLGRGHYTERDIQEAARAFTGWHVRGESFAFVSRYHDRDAKEVFGQRGAFGGEDIVRLAVGREASCRFVAAKLLRWFVHPEPTADEVTALAAHYRAQDRHIGRTLRTLLRSRLFFSPRAYRSRVKSPADLAVGLVRSLGARAAPQALARAMAEMGEVLLEPPSVEGWPGERAWITSATWLVRCNFATALFAGQRGLLLEPAADELLVDAWSADDHADLAVRLLLDDDVSDDGRAAVRALAASPAGRGPGGAGAILHAVQNLPEAHLL